MKHGAHALVIEGGGMKAAYANGVLSAFEEAGYRPFDAVYGTSAGGALAAWFSARQAVYAEKTWEYAADRRILSYRRALSRRGPLLDHEALLDIVYEREHPLDQAALRRASHPVVVSATDADSGEGLYHDLRDGPILPWLKATGRLPMVGGDPVLLDGRRLLDGGIMDPMPVRRAAQDGCTRLTVVSNNTPGVRRPDRRAAALFIARRFPALRAPLLAHERMKDEAVAWTLDPPAGIVAYLVAPARPLGIGRLSRDMAKIADAIGRGREDGRRHLDRL